MNRHAMALESGAAPRCSLADDGGTQHPGAVPADIPDRPRHGKDSSCRRRNAGGVRCRILLRLADRLVASGNQRCVARRHRLSCGTIPARVALRGRRLSLSGRMGHVAAAARAVLCVGRHLPSSDRRAGELDRLRPRARAARPHLLVRDADMRVILESALTCPECGAGKTETMPTDACLYFYECTSCRAVLRPKPGDCCVFCSYGTMPCPPIQAGDAPDSCCKPLA